MFEHSGLTLTKNSLDIIDTVWLKRNLCERISPFYFYWIFLEPEVKPVEETIPETIVPESKHQPTPKGIHNCILYCPHIFYLYVMYIYSICKILLKVNLKITKSSLHVNL